jgi:hypothetical protein
LDAFQTYLETPFRDLGLSINLITKNFIWSHLLINNYFATLVEIAEQLNCLTPSEAVSERTIKKQRRILSVFRRRTSDTLFKRGLFLMHSDLA